MTIINLTGNSVIGGQSIGRKEFAGVKFANRSLHIQELFELCPVLFCMHECCASRSLICCLAILSNEGNGSRSRNRFTEVCRWLDVIWVTTTRNRNAELWMKSVSLDEVHVEVSNLVVSKIVASTRCKRKHIKMKVL